MNFCRRVVCGVFLVAFAVALRADELALTGRAMGTTWSVKIAHHDRGLSREIVAERVAQRLEELEQIFSTYRESSDVSRFNAAPTTEWQPVSTEMGFVADRARRISELTGGAFDITVDPLVRLWGFGPGGRGPRLPGENEIARARERVGWEKIELSASRRALRKTSLGVTVDFSSIAKGFASDQVSALLVTLGAPNHLVQVGGDMKAAGCAANGAAWRLGIEEPRAGRGAIACVVAAADLALSTSGDYRNFFEMNGKRFGHIIDPRNGRPVASALAAVSVLAESSAQASALATALFVLGPVEGMALARRERFACLFVVREDGALVSRATPAFQEHVVNSSRHGVAAAR